MSVEPKAETPYGRIHVLMFMGRKCDVVVDPALPFPHGHDHSYTYTWPMSQFVVDDWIEDWSGGAF